jgi:hypothetical protein
VTFTPKAAPPLPPTTTPGSIYLRVRSLTVAGQGGCAWHGDRPYTVACSTAGKAITLVVDARAPMGSATLAGQTGRYMLDDQPISPVLTGEATCNPCMSWTWDARALRGVHGLWFQVAGSAQYRPFASMVFGQVDQTPQYLPVIPQWAVTRTPGGTSLYYDGGIAAFLSWRPGLLPARAQPWIRPGVRVDELTEAQRLAQLEPGHTTVTPAASGVRHHYGAGMPQVRVTPVSDFPLMAALPPGQPFVAAWHPQAGNRAEFAKSGVDEREPHDPGARGLNTQSPYVSVVGLPFPAPGRAGAS